jgi:hypothetical protein
MRREPLLSSCLRDFSINCWVRRVGSGYHKPAINVKEEMAKGLSDSEGSELYYYHGVR